MSRMFGVDISMVNKWVRVTGFPGGIKGPWKIHDVIAWLREQSKGNKPANSVPSTAKLEDDPELFFRLEKARIMQLKRLEMEGNLVPHDDARIFKDRLANVVRRFGERIDRQCGEAGRELVEEMLDEAERETKAYYQRLENNVGSANATV